MKCEGLLLGNWLVAGLGLRFARAMSLNGKSMRFFQRINTIGRRLFGFRVRAKLSANVASGGFRP
jgi:hypothetical protein